MLSNSEIMNAIKNTKSLAGAARYLHVSYNTLKKYMKIHQIPIKQYANQAGIGIRIAKPRVNGWRLDLILAGRFNGTRRIQLWRLRNEIVRLGIIPERCDMCGFEERRLIDGKVPLMLSFRDKHRYFNIENIQLLCPNCYYLVGKDNAAYYKFKENIYKQKDIEDLLPDVDWDKIATDNVEANVNQRVKQDVINEGHYDIPPEDSETNTE
jgi:hypothetical protein